MLQLRNSSRYKQLNKDKNQNQYMNFASSAQKDENYYLPDDFEKIPKVDAHLHYSTFNDAYLKYAGSINMRLFTINTDLGTPINTQFEIAKSLKNSHPSLIDFIGTFSPANFFDRNFARKTIEQIERYMDAGAKGIKIWKNIGMALQDKSGKYIMVDDPAFSPIFAFLEKNRIPLLAHLGEPRNCWLPYDDITLDGDLLYYKNNPEYHMYQHPEVPTHEQQIAARDNLLERYPQMKFIGAHLGSLEWNIDEVASRFDRYPNFFVDLSARMGHIQLQVIPDREKVRNFFVKYKNRLLYGSDCSISGKSIGIKSKILQQVAPGIFVKRICKTLYRTCKNDWLFLATGEMVPVEKINITNAPETIEGLKLPKQVIDQVFNKNADRIYQIG